MFSVLVTSTSFQDQKGDHLSKIESDKRLSVKFARGPLSKEQLMPYVGKFDAIICGDDEYDDEILSLNKDKLKILSKYGVGLDRINLNSAKKYGIAVSSCAGINSKSVAEHVFALLLSSAKNMEDSIQTVRNYKWERHIGFDLKDKNILIVGYGNIGKEVLVRAKAFEMNVGVFDPFAKLETGLKVFTNLEEAYKWAQIISLHCPLLEATRGIINSHLMSKNKNVTIINTARGGLVIEKDILEAIQSGQVRSYLADVIDEEPITNYCLLPQNKNVILTPHIASRTSDNIVKQAMMALENMYKGLNLE